MGIAINQSLKSAFYTFCGAFLGGVIMLLSMRYFDKTLYGFQQNLVKISAMISYLGIVGFNYTLLIYGQRYHNMHEKRSAFLWQSIKIPSLVTCAICILMIVSKPWLVSLYHREEDVWLMNKYYYLFPLLTVIYIITMWFEGYLQSINKSSTQNLLREIIPRVLNILLLLLYAFDTISFNQFIIWYVLVLIVPILFLARIANKDIGFRWKVKRKLKRKEKSVINNFAFYQMLGVVGIVVIFQIDAFMLAPIAKDGLDAIAVYSVAVFIVSLVRNPTRVIGVAITPSLVKVYQQKNKVLLNQYFNRSAINMQMAALLIISVLFVNLNNGLYLLSLIKPGYEEVKPLIMLLLVGQLAEAFLGPSYELIGISKYYRYNFWISIGLIVLIVVLNYILVTEIGVLGAAIATSVGLIIYNIAKGIVAQRKLNVKVIRFTTVKLYVVSIGIILMVYFLPDIDHLVFNIFYKSALVLGAVLAFFYYSKSSEDFNKIVDRYIKAKK